MLETLHQISYKMFEIHSSYTFGKLMLSYVLINTYDKDIYTVQLFFDNNLTY